MSTYHQHWNETGFGTKLNLLLASYRTHRLAMPHRPFRQSANAYSALSSTCHSIVGTAGAAIKSHLTFGPGVFRLPFDFITWVPLGAWCYLRMLKYSNEMVFRAGGYKHLTADQCDIRQSILRLRGWMPEAERCIKEGLAKDPRGHTLGQLLIGKAACLERRNEGESGRDEQLVIAMTIKSIASTIREQNPQQAIRLYRGIADILARIDGYSYEALSARVSAYELATSIGAKDQLAKL
jgi:hypothetical protein